MVELPSPPPQQPRRFGTYTTVREIARGGQGAVMEARNEASGERVALKVLIHPSASSRKRFQQEAQVLLRLSHPNLIRVRDLGERGGFPYLAMEFIEGEDLQTIVDERGIPEPAWSAEVLAKVADALQYCHEQGIVHRDLKPANVLIERGTGRPVLVDFGLVKRDAEAMRLSALDDASQFSRTGVGVRGTPCFMAPEQAHSQLGSIGPATDVYALGATLYYLLTGEPPIADGPMASVLYHVVATKPADPRKHHPETPRWLADLCLRCLAKQPAARPASAAEVAAALRGGAAAAPARPSRVGGGWLRTALTLSVGVAIGLGVGVPLGRSQAPAPPPPAPPVVVTATPAPVATASVAPVETDTEPLAAILGRIPNQLKKREYRAVIAGCDRVLRRSLPGSGDYREALRRRGWAYYQLKDYPAALRDHDAAIKLDPTNSALYVDRARIKASAGDDAGASADFDRGVALSPHFAQRYEARARHRRRLKDYEGAIRDYSKVIELKPGDAAAWAGRGWMRISLLRYEQALVDYDQTLILEPSNVHRVARAIAYRWLGDLERAQRDLDWVIDRNKGYMSRALAYCVMLDITRKDLPRALADAERAVKLGPKDAVAWRYRGDAHRLRGELDAALRDYAQALTLSNGYAAAIAGRGLVRLHQGHQLLARKDLELALKTMPGWEWNREEAEAALAGLKKK